MILIIEVIISGVHHHGVVRSDGKLLSASVHRLHQYYRRHTGAVVVGLPGRRSDGLHRHSTPKLARQQCAISVGSFRLGRVCDFF
jgi:hypothetical protein